MQQFKEKILQLSKTHFSPLAEQLNKVKETFIKEEQTRRYAIFYKHDKTYYNYNMRQPEPFITSILSIEEKTETLSKEFEYLEIRQWQNFVQNRIARYVADKRQPEDVLEQIFLDLLSIENFLKRVYPQFPSKAKKLVIDLLGVNGIDVNDVAIKLAKEHKLWSREESMKKMMEHGSQFGIITQPLVEEYFAEVAEAKIHLKEEKPHNKSAFVNETSENHVIGLIFFLAKKIQLDEKFVHNFLYLSNGAFTKDSLETGIIQLSLLKEWIYFLELKSTKQVECTRPFVQQLSKHLLNISSPLLKQLKPTLSISFLVGFTLRLSTKKSPIPQEL